MERRHPTTPPLAHAPRDAITACDQVPHSDERNKCRTVHSSCCCIFPRAAQAYVLHFFWGGAAGPVRNAPERSWHASGSIFTPSRRFWTRFGPILMIWARADILGPTWTSRTRPRPEREALAQPIHFFLAERKTKKTTDPGSPSWAQNVGPGPNHEKWAESGPESTV